MATVTTPMTIPMTMTMIMTTATTPPMIAAVSDDVESELYCLV